MRVVLRRIESLGGLSVAADETLETDRITLGRGTDQNVQLSDMRVTLAHAEIRLQPDGSSRIECLTENPVWLNGSPVLKRSLAVGDTIDCGRFRITLRAPPPGTALVLEIEERISAREERGQRRARFRLSLAEAGLGKRRAAWLLAGLVLLGGLVAPFVMRYTSGQDGGKSLDAIWQAGPPSAAHSPFIENCASCHQEPFARVANKACLACHENQPQHSSHAEVLALADLQDAQCHSCHLEHSGRDGLIARNTDLCTGCHAEPDQRYALALLQPVSRFDGDHPAFTLSLPAWRDGAWEVAEAAQHTDLREQSGLQFPHDLHLAAKGVSSPQGLRQLDCADCHRPMGRGFLPIRMQDHCASCHQLDFDPDRPARRLPHGEPAEVVAIIRDHFARAALAGDVREAGAPEVVRMVRRPGTVLTKAESEAALAWADARAAQVIEDVFERRVCAECHSVERGERPEAPWTIAPVSLTRTFFRAARFDHAEHRTESCDRCHQAESSTESGDVLIPDIANCRQCHGDPGVSGKTATACVDCHGFHIAERSHFNPPAPGKRR